MVAGSVARSVGDVRGMFGTVSRQMPGWRIRRLDANTRISLALLFDEQAQHAPNDVSFMYEDRSYTYGENKGPHRRGGARPARRGRARR